MMDIQMQELLDLLGEDDPVIVTHHWRKRLHDSRGASFWQPYRSLELAPCPYCHRGHRVQLRCHGKRCFFTCNAAKVTHLIPINRLRRWRLNLPQLLTHMAQELGIHPYVTPLHTSSIWRLGTVTLKESQIEIDLWFCRRLFPSTLVWLLNQNLDSHTVLLTLGPKPFLKQLSLPTVCFDLALLVRGSGHAHLNRHVLYQRLTHAFQRVRFEPQNGDLWVDDNRVCTVTPATPQFYFVQCLWEAFDAPISHDDIFTYCCRQLAKRDGVEKWQSEYLSSTFCHTMKRLLKRQAYDKALCDEVIQAIRTHDEQNAYRLTTPQSATGAVGGNRQKLH